LSGSVDLGLLLSLSSSRNRKSLGTCRNFPEKERETKKRKRLRFRSNPRKFKGERIETLGRGWKEIVHISRNRKNEKIQVAN